MEYSILVSVFAGKRELCERVFDGDDETVGDAVFSVVAYDIRS
jgi:hypothetical protein